MTSAPCASRCSTIGPSASAGMKVSAPTRTIVADEQRDEERRVRRQRAADAGTSFFFASEPAIASTGTMSQ